MSRESGRKAKRDYDSRRRQEEAMKGHRRVTLSLTPRTHLTIEAIKASMPLGSNADVVNYVFERLAADPQLQQELLAVST